MNIYIIGLLCFVLGYITHKFFSSMVSLGRTMILCKHMILDCLFISLQMSEDVAFIRSIKTKEMRDLGVNDKTISHSLMMFDKTMNDWKNTCIQKILVSYPMIARGQLKFDDWDSAIKYLQENR
tara:strand:- start:49 stop:420 length:372 start_codon:yes stop_codon:yes gene_type:complete